MSLLALSDEIVVQIFSYKDLERRDLYHISLVNRRLCSLATPIIYYDINLVHLRLTQFVRLENFLRTLDESPERGELVRILTLEWGVPVNTGPLDVFSILRKLPMLHTLIIYNLTDSSHPYVGLAFPEYCPMAFLRNLTIAAYGITATEIVQYTTFPRLEYFDVTWFSGRSNTDLDSFTISTGDPSTKPPLRYLKLCGSKALQPLAFRNILSHLGRLERLDWELDGTVAAETDILSISDSLIPVSQTLVELHLSQMPRNDSVYMASQLVDFAKFTALKVLSIDDRFLFSYHPPLPIEHRHDEEMSLYGRLPPSLRKLVILLNSGAYALGSPKLAEHDYRWVVNLVEHSPALGQLIIQESYFTTDPRASEVQDRIWPQDPQQVVWDQPDVVRRLFEANGITVKLVIRQYPSLRAFNEIR